MNIVYEDNMQMRSIGNDGFIIFFISMATYIHRNKQIPNGNACYMNIEWNPHFNEQTHCR